jgi:c-di-GMP-binding flagellar brake protein YcgR
MGDFSDRRKEPRKKLMAFTPVYEKAKGVLLGYIRDLTFNGVLVIGEKKLDANTQTILEFELPGGLPGVTATQLAISARVARCKMDESSQTYQIGFEFTAVEPEQTRIIQALLERYHFRHKM